MTGRPSLYTEELTDLICERIAGGESLVQICRGADMPARSTVMRWLMQSEPFQDKYARARESQAEVLADEIIDIADASAADPALGRLRVDARKWAASKLAPKKYGEKISQEISGADGEPLQVVVKFGSD